MASLRERMIEDMILAGYVPGTRRTFLDQVRNLAKHYMIAPDQLTERQAAATPRCPHCDSVSTVLVAEVARQGRR